MIPQRKRAAKILPQPGELVQGMFFSIFKAQESFKAATLLFKNSQLLNGVSIYMSIIGNAVTILACTPYCLDVIRKDNIEKNIIENIIPIIPERESFIKEKPILRVFFVEEEVRKKLLNVLDIT